MSNSLKKIIDENLKSISREIDKSIFSKRKVNAYYIFLIGAQKDSPRSNRESLLHEFDNKSNYRIFYPEEIFMELLVNPEKRHNLLDLENKLGGWVHSIVIIPESPGSFVELGAFSNHPYLQNKLIVIQDEKYRRKKSFIDLGPIRFLKHNKTSKVLFHDWNNGDIKKLGFRVSNEIRKMAKGIEIDKTISNPIEAQHFIRIALYLFEGLNRNTLITLLMYTKDIGYSIAEEVAISALNILSKQGVIRKERTQYTFSKSGLKDFINSVGNDYIDKNIFQSLDKIRIDILNSITRINRKAKYL